MTPRQVLATLAARWPWALAVFLIVVTVTIAASLTMLKRYTATASVMLDPRSLEQIAGGALNSQASGAYMATQMDLLMSERVGRGVIQALNLRDEKRLHEAWLKAGHGEGDFEAWLSDALKSSLLVKPAPMSNVVTITYTADTGADAARFANAYVKSYIDTSLKMRMERLRESGTFFDERTKELRLELEGAQAKLSEYQQKHGLLVGEDKVNLEATRLAELGAQLLVAQSANAEVSGRMKRAGVQTDKLQEVWRNPAVAQLSAEITREEVRLRELTARLGDSHPQLVEQEARLSEMKARLAVEKARAASNASFDNSATQNRVTQLSESVEAQRAKVLRMQVQREQSSPLQRNVEMAQRAYDSMQLRLNQASVESQNTHANLTVLKEATVPMAPSSPNLLKNIGGSLALGILLGSALVLGREHFDRRLRTVDDVSELKQAMLVSLPVSGHANRSLPDTSRTKLMKQRVLTGLPRPIQPTT